MSVPKLPAQLSSGAEALGRAFVTVVEIEIISSTFWGQSILSIRAKRNLHEAW